MQKPRRCSPQHKILEKLEAQGVWRSRKSQGSEGVEAAEEEKPRDSEGPGRATKVERVEAERGAAIIEKAKALRE